MEIKVQTLKIKCPHCGWVRTIKLDIAAGQADVYRGPGDSLHAASDALKATAQKIAERLKGGKLDEENSWLPMPACPNPECKQPYQYNPYKRTTRP